MKKLYLIDVSSMFFRAFYAIRPLSSPTGLPVNAIYGFLSMVIKLLKQEKPEYIVFCYDRKEPSFRHEMYTEYKAHRSEMPEELVQQMPYLKQIAGLLGIPSLEIPTYEADDLIGTLTHLGLRNKMEVYIVSGDKDFGQLIGPSVFLYDTMKNVKYDVDGVKEKWGVRPDQFIDYLALVGDSSDNIPGVKGIGPKGAITLLEQFGSVEDIYNNIDQVASKGMKEKLIAAKEMAFLSKKLVTICIDCEIDTNIESYKLKSFKRDELKNFLNELNFKALEKTLLGEDNNGGSSASLTPPAKTEITMAALIDPISTKTFQSFKINLTTMNLAELLAGVEVMPAGRRRTELHQSLIEQVMPLFEDRILSFDRKAAQVFARINASAQAAGNPISFADCAIAAIASARGFMLATRNVRDFKGTNIEILNPWSAPMTSRAGL